MQLEGRVNGSAWTSLGDPTTITEGNRAAFFIEVDDEVAGDTKGIEELPDSWDATLLDGVIEIRAIVVDETGNTTTWEAPSSLTIHGIGAHHRDSIKVVTADKADGWWGPESEGLPIKIQLTASNPITVDENAGTPSIKLETGTTVGVADYVSGSGSTILVFDYNPGVGEESSDLAFKLTFGDAIIDLNGGLMYSVGGNFLKAGPNNASSPVLPKPNDGADGLTSLDEAKDLIIDGVAPIQSSYFSLSTYSADLAVQLANDAFAESHSSYYNSAIDRFRFSVYLGSGPDESLMIQDWAADNSDCNSANGCGKIQIKAFMVAAGAETPDLRDYYDEAVDYDDLHSENWQGNPTPYQYIDIDAGPPENCGGCDFETDFVNTLGTIAFAEGNVLIFEADLIDLAGNIATTTNDNLIVDRIPPAVATVSIIETEALDANGISSTTSMNNVAGYWNRHNTGLRLTVPLEATDASLVGGNVYIYGGNNNVPVTSWERLGYYNDNIYDISQAEVDAAQSIVPEEGGLLEDIETRENGDTWPDGVEEMDDFEEGIFIGFTARVYDKANNYTNFDYDNTILWVDTTSPEIQNVTSLNTAKAYLSLIHI